MNSLIIVIFFSTGDLLPQHMHIFHRNEFFHGTKIQDPHTKEPLRDRMPSTLSNDTIDFLEVFSFLLLT